MKSTRSRARRLVTAVATLAFAASLLIVPGQPALAHHFPNLDIEPEVSVYNRDEVVFLTAILDAPAPSQVRVQFENEGGSNDLDGKNPHPADFGCTIGVQGTECTINYTAAEPGRDPFRAWIDHDFMSNPVTIRGPHDATYEADDTEGRDESDEPGEGCLPQSDPQGTRVPREPDCTDVVDVFTEILEVIPDVQLNRQPGTTIRLTARTFTPAGPDGVNVDFENENGSNDPDRSNSPTTPDLSCEVLPLQQECFIEYVGQGGTDIWRSWIDHDRTQSTVEADQDEGRFSGGETGGPGNDCGHPGDTNKCGGSVRVGDPVNEEFDTPATPGTGCKDPAFDAETPSQAESDCTDVVEVRFAAGPAALLDCDDQAGAQAPNDTEREVNPAGGTERYRCAVSDAFGTGRDDVFVKAEIENGINDPDSAATESQPSYDQPDYICETTTDEDADAGIGLIGDSGVCYIDVAALEGEFGTAEICFWVGTTADATNLCGEELTGENQQADGTDTANDLADQTEKTWENVATFRLDCGPETDTNPAGTAHTVGCTVTSPSGATVNGVNIDAEATGTNDPDMSSTQQTPDFSCTSQNAGACSFTHGPGGSGTTSAEGVTTYRAWIDADNQNATSEADTTEVRDENVTPGARAEPDNTDVVDKTWGPPPATLTMTPETDTASVGECNAYTVTVKDRTGAPVQGAAVDVEQRHESAGNQTSNDEPTVSFCKPDPAGGPNTTDVDETRGDLAPPAENPDNRGTAGGETVATTDQNGQLTFGIEVTPGQGSNGSGAVAVSAFFETADNDDPDANEPVDSSSKRWNPAAGEPGVPAAVDLQPGFATDARGDARTYTATVSDTNGDPVAGATVEWSEEGVGTFVEQQTTTNENGQATATVGSNEEGEQTITVRSPDCGSTPCSDSSVQRWVKRVSSGRCKGFGEGTTNDTDDDGDGDVFVGTQGNDLITGTGEGDRICGLGGDDSLDGGGGNDSIQGGGGKDTLRGNRGNDRLEGGSDNDVIQGGPGNDTLIGGGGKDTLEGGPGRDRLVGGGEADALNGGSGRDTCRGGRGRDRERSC